MYCKGNSSLLIKNNRPSFCLGPSCYKKNGVVEDYGVVNALKMRYFVGYWFDVASLGGKNII